MEVYMDDMLIKSLKAQDHLVDLQETFQVLRKHQMKLNPSKCAFGVSSGKFLGYMVSRSGIEANPEKVQAILNMQSPASTKELQRLTDRSSEQRSRLFRPLFFRRQIWVTVISYAGETQQRIRSWVHLSGDLFRHPMLRLVRNSSPASRLDLCGVAASFSSSSDLGLDRRSIFSANSGWLFCRRDPAAIPAAVHLLQHRGFSSSVAPFSGFIGVAACLLVSLAILGWFTQLCRLSSPVLADVIAEFIPENGPEHTANKEEEAESTWTLYVDGSVNARASRAGLVIISPNGECIKYALRFGFKATNNEAEYETLLAGLRMAKALEVERLVAYTDSQLITGQVQGEYEAKDEKMKTYLHKIEDIKGFFKKFSIRRIPREENAQADALAQMAITEEDKAIPVGYLDEPSTVWDWPQKIHQVAHSMEWAEPIIRYIENEELPQDRMEANYILKDIHEGLCGNHAGGRSLAHKAIRQGYFWPTMRTDALEFVKKCDKCQRFANVRSTKVIVTNNGKQLESEQFLDFCNELGIKVHFSSPAHPHANGQVEVTNRTILKMIKTGLEKAKGLWPEQLPGVLWAYRTTVRTPTGETPFGLAFGSEAVILVETKVATFKTKYFEPQQNGVELRLNLDLVEEKRKQAQVKVAAYQRMISKYYNARVKPRRFEPGDLVLR
ncbi:uncharacterized protein LOC132304712 [Cornus florida]|uniref:uncharacterized protein LOC132304712 n=1 Tax=Cornus florida TaxID=4283 RepID=UPI00289D8A92|nr:uncharacterized protein LOC132304712 [Cornus florida]